MGETERLRAALQRIHTISSGYIGDYADEITAIAAQALNPPADDRLDRLTDLQRETFEFIRSEIASKGRPPTFREIGERFGVTLNAVAERIEAIRRKGLIRREPNKSRTLAVVEAS